MQSPDIFCRYCGTQNSRSSETCIECGSPLYDTHKSSISPKYNSNSQITSKPPFIFFNIPEVQFIIKWTDNGRIYNSKGEEIAQISQQSTINGIDYYILEHQTHATILIRQVTPTLFRLSCDSIPLGEIEIHNFQMNIQYHPKPQTADFTTQLEDFMIKKSIYSLKKEMEIGEFHRTKDKEYPLNITHENEYTLKVITTQSEITQIFCLIIIYLKVYRSNPYR